MGGTCMGVIDKKTRFGSGNARDRDVEIFGLRRS
jgi:hypothetical protein